MVLVVQCEPVAASGLVAERVVVRRLHRFDVDDGDTSLRVLHHDVNRPVAVGDALFRDAAEINVAEDRAVLGVDHHRILRRMAEDVDALIERVEQDAVRLEGGGSDVNRLDQLHRLRVEHRNRLAAREAVT